MNALTSKAAGGPPTFRDAALLACISSLGPFAANTYVPSFSFIARDLSASLVAVQQSLSIYLAMFAISSLFIGALSDATGRRPVIIGGTIIFAFASLGAMFAPTIEILYLCRIVQGMCAAVGPVMSQAVIRDRWDGVHAARLIALTAMLFALAPALAPMVGGAIAVVAGWRWVFGFLACFNLTVCILVFFHLKESLPNARRIPFRPKATAISYAEAGRNSAFMAGVVGHGFCFMGGIVYSAGAADFVINIMKMNADDFGWLMIPFLVATMIGAWIGPRLMAHIGSWRLIFGGCTLLVLSGIAGIALEFHQAVAYPLVIVFPTFYNLAMSSIRPTMNVMNLDYFPRNRGMAASIQQFCQTTAFCLSSAILVPVVMGEAWRYSAVMLGAGLMTLILWAVVRKTRDASLPKTEV